MKTPDDNSTAISEPISRMIPRSQLTPWPDQPRQEFTEDAKQELRQSLMVHGFKKAYPLLCRPLEYKAEPDNATGIGAVFAFLLENAGRDVAVEEIYRKTRETHAAITSWLEENCKRPAQNLARVGLGVYRLTGAPAVVPQNGFEILYRTHETSVWRLVEDDIVLPVAPSWSCLATEDDVAQALEWLPKFQIVDGERRWTEAGELNIHEVPCVIEEMTDSEALEMALISALQKQGLNPMEEADGIRRLLEFSGADGAPLHTRKSVAVTLGVSERHVKSILNLCNLRGTRAAQAIVKKELSPTHGALLGALPTRALRDEWTEKVIANPWGSSPMPTVMLQDKLQEHVMKQLRNCGFDTTDEALVPMKSTSLEEGGGACTDCRWNTRNVDEESEGMKSKMHMCMLPACFREKQVAAHERWREEVKPNESLPIEDNDALWAPTGEALAFHSIYVELGDRPHDLDLKPTVQCAEPWKKLIKGRDVVVVAARDGKGKTHLLVVKELAIAAAIENKHHIFRKEKEMASPAASGGGSPGGIPAVDWAVKSMERETATAEEQALKELAEIEAERVWLAQVGVLVETISVAKRLPEGFFAELYEEMEDFFGDGKSIAAERRGVPGEDLKKTVVKGNDLTFAALLLEVMLQDNWWSNGAELAESSLKRYGKIFGVDFKLAAKEARATLKAEIAAEKKSKEATEGMVWKERAGCEFVLNTNGMVDNPERCELVFPKTVKISASVSVACLKGEWVYGWFVQGPKFGTSEGCRADGTKYGTRDLALRSGLLAILQQMKGAGVAEEVTARVAGWIGSVAGDVAIEKAEAKGPGDAAAKKAKKKKKAAPHPAAKVIAAVKGKGKK